MRRAPHLTLLLAVLAALLIVPSSALGESSLEQYQRTGTINPCTASGPGGVPNDIEQYAPDFLEALKDAQRQGCNRGASTTAPTETKNGVPVLKGGTLPPGSTFVPKPPAPPKTALFRDDKVVKHQPLASGAEVSTPAPVIVLAIMVLFALALGALLGIRRYMGWGYGGPGPIRHAFGEAGFRLRALTKRA